VAEAELSEEPETEITEPELPPLDESPELTAFEEEEYEEEKTFAELFSLESARIKPIQEDDEEHLLMTGGKKKKAKKKKSYTIEYDPDQDQTFKQFKYRDEDDWDNW
jgi:hypothetical protein